MNEEMKDYMMYSTVGQVPYQHVKGSKIQSMFPLTPERKIGQSILNPTRISQLLLLQVCLVYLVAHRRTYDLHLNMILIALCTSSRSHERHGPLL